MYTSQNILNSLKYCNTLFINYLTRCVYITKYIQYSCSLLRCDTIVWDPIPIDQQGTPTDAVAICQRVLRSQGLAYQNVRAKPYTLSLKRAIHHARVKIPKICWPIDWIGTCKMGSSIPVKDTMCVLGNVCSFFFFFPLSLQ